MVSVLVPGEGIQVVCKPQPVLLLLGFTLTQVPINCSKMP